MMGQLFTKVNRFDANSPEMAANGKAGYTRPVRAAWKNFGIESNGYW